MFSVIATLVNKLFFFFSILALSDVLKSGNYDDYVTMLAVGGVIEAVCEPAVEYLAHKAPRKLRWLWGLGLLLVPAAPYSPPLVLGVVWGLYMALGKASAFKILPKGGAKGAVLIALSGVLCCFDFFFLMNGIWWMVAFMTIFSSSFIFFVEVEDEKVDMRELVEVSAKVFTSAFLVKALWGLVVVQMPVLLILEKQVKALAGIPSAVLKLTASVKAESLKAVKITALLVGLLAALFDWKILFPLAFTYKKAELERALQFKKLSNRILVKNLCEAILLAIILLLFQGDENAPLIFLVYQSFNLVLLVP